MNIFDQGILKCRERLHVYCKDSLFLLFEEKKPALIQVIKSQDLCMNKPPQFTAVLLVNEIRSQSKMCFG